MNGMEHAIEKVANALHGDQCAEDPDPGERCNCGADDFYRQAEIALDTLREVGLLAPAPLREEWGVDCYLGFEPEAYLERRNAEKHLAHEGGSLLRRYVSGWEPWEGGD